MKQKGLFFYLKIQGAVTFYLVHWDIIVWLIASIIPEYSWTIVFSISVKLSLLLVLGAFGMSTLPSFSVFPLS